MIVQISRVFRGDIVEVAMLREGVAVSERILRLPCRHRAPSADRRVARGVSTRSLVLAIPALQARALVSRRDFVAPEDIESLAIPLFHHRISTVPGADARPSLRRR